MNKKLKQSFIVFFLTIFMTGSFAFAEDARVNTSETSSVAQLEITFPIQKDDFLLFYGVTKDQETNTKVESLRKDFMNKFQALKDDYKKSVNDTIGENTLISPIPLASKDLNKVVSQVKKIDSKTLIKNYTLKIDKEKSSSVDSTISPIVNTIDTSSQIHTENSGWFQKIKSIFNW